MAMQRAKDGAFSEALVRGEENEILCVAIGEDAALGVMVERGALTGFLSWPSSLRQGRFSGLWKGHRATSER